MEWRRSCADTYMQVAQLSDPQVTIPVHWYFSPPGAKVFRGVNAFTSGIWDRDAPNLPPHVGEQPPYQYPYTRGENVGGYRGQCVVGTDANFALGWTAAQLAASATPLPNCCAAPPTFIDQKQSVNAHAYNPSNAVEQVQSVLMSPGARARVEQVQTVYNLSAFATVAQAQKVNEPWATSPANVDQVQSVLVSFPASIHATLHQVQTIATTYVPDIFGIHQVQSVTSGFTDDVDQVQTIGGPYLFYDVKCTAAVLAPFVTLTISGTGALAIFNFVGPVFTTGSGFTYFASGPGHSLSISMQCSLLVNGFYGIDVNDALPFTYQQKENVATQFFTGGLSLTFPPIGPGFAWAPGDTLTISVV
jgi:hypothetical protein